MTAVDSVPDVEVARLLATAPGTADRSSLGSHQRAHPPLVVPRRRDRQWSARLVADLHRSGLTGRGGAGFPTARKTDAFEAAARARSARNRPVVVVNVMESEPASAKDQVLATAAPHLVLDGAAVLAAAVNATAVHVCVAADHLSAVRSLEAAVDQRRAAGIDPVPVVVSSAPARYVAGEESALAHWLDGGGARPTFRPDRPAALRVAGHPALVDNAETLAQVALIARHGPDWFRSVGVADAPGTTLLTVSGAVARPGVFEVALGTPLQAVLERAGADPQVGGVLLGGYGGTWLPARRVAAPLAPGPLAAVGCSLGAGVVAVLPTSSCGLAETARIARWMASESAGQCGPCVFGLPAVAADLAEVSGGRPTVDVMERLWFRLGEVEGRGACHHPDGVSRLVRSALRAFAADVDHHLRHGPCPGAGAPTVLPFPYRKAASPWQ